MQIIPKQHSIRHKNSEECLVWEYPSTNAVLNGAIAEIRGRYPFSGFAANTTSHELAYVLRGRGTIETKSGSSPLHEGDMILILPGDSYAWNGDLTLFLSCAPPFDPLQHIHKETP